jgi:transcriptional regulator with GAF, ATPase, and Fis domain
MEVILSLYIEKKRTQDELLRLKTEVLDREELREVIGQSKAMQTVFHLLQRVAPTDSTVLILGESGTGKEVIATAIHRLSQRKDKPLVKLNCVAIPEGLLESELFGHEKGAFTGALVAKLGKFELAHSGTLFLDEIGDMSAQTQAKVLRALQEREFERVGGTRTIKVDVRLIAATNKDLSKEVKEGRFREDLYYRLNVISISLPPLRERREDIPFLVDFFVEEANRKLKSPIYEVSKDVLKVLMDYSWPGNVRELKNAIERAAVLSDNGILRVEHLPPNLRGEESFVPPTVEAPVSFKQASEKSDKEIILNALERANWVQTEAAKLLNLTPKNLWAKIRKHGIKMAKGEE